MKILVVEDEAGISGFLRQGLEEENFEVTVASDGAEGLRLALSQHSDLLLLDWMLPGITGIEVCNAFRKSNKETPVIFLTSKDTVQEAVAGLTAGANDYIRKPFSFDELLARINAQLRPKQHEPDLMLGSLRLSRKTHQVFRGAEEIPLTQKEFSLLEYLLRNKGRVCTRNQIIEDVWNIHFEYDTGVIDVFINSLRKKLNLRIDEDFIRTIRGVGYIAKDS